MDAQQRAIRGIGKFAANGRVCVRMARDMEEWVADAIKTEKQRKYDADHQASVNKQEQALADKYIRKGLRFECERVPDVQVTQGRVAVEIYDCKKQRLCSVDLLIQDIQ